MTRRSPIRTVLTLLLAGLLGPAGPAFAQAPAATSPTSPDHALPVLAAPAEFRQRAAELVLIFNGERQPSASFSTAALQRGKVSAQQVDERLGKFTAQARARFGRAAGIVEILPLKANQAIVVLDCAEDELAVQLTVEPASPYEITGISAGPATAMEAALARQRIADAASGPRP